MIKRPRRFQLLSRFLFLDLFLNRKTRWVFVYLVIIVGLGSALYHWLEGWGWLDSVYFVVITITTIGYGDLHPTTPATKMITIFYGLNGIIIILTIYDIIRTLRGFKISKPPTDTEKRHDG